MTIAGICFCTYVAYCLIRFGFSKDCLINIIFIDALFAIFKINYGYLFKYDAEELLASEITLLTLLLLSTFHLKNVKFKINLLVYSVCLVFVCLMSLFMLGLNPTEAPVVGYNNSGWDGYMRGEAQNFAPPELGSQNFKMFIRLVAYTYILIFIWSYMRRCEWEKLRQKLNVSVIIFLCICVFELIIERIFSYDFSNILTTFFGLGRATGIDIDRTQGLSREPSYYAIALYYTSIILVSNFFTKEKSFKNGLKFSILLTTSVSLSLLSGSLSALIFLGPLFFYYRSFTSVKSKTLIVIIAFCILLVTWTLFSDALMSLQFYERLMFARTAFWEGVALSYAIGTDFSSELVRLISIIETFNAFLSRVWYGVGLGSVYSLSGIISILGSIGILGFGFWLLLLFYTSYKQPFIRVIALLAPFTLVADLNTLYDPAFIYLIPLAISKY